MSNSGPDSRELPLLTALRGFAALLVLLFHARLILFPQWKEALAAHTLLLENAYLAVDLFFILSGLVLGHVYLNLMRGTGQPLRYRQFLWLRLSRIYPLFLLTLLLMVAWEGIKQAQGLTYYGGPLFGSWGMNGIPAFEGPFNRLEALPEQFFLAQGLLTKSMLAWNVSSWSLSVEWGCYLLFPLLLPLAGWQSRWRWLAALLALATLGGVHHQLGSLDATTGIAAVLRGLAGFVLGLSLLPTVRQRALARWLNNDAVLAALVILPLLLLHLPQSLPVSLALIVAYALLVYAAAIQQPRQSPVFSLLENRFTRWLGDLSFSVYLWHTVLLLAGVELLNWLAPATLASWYAQTGWLAALLGIGGFVLLTLAVSAISYHCFERPVQHWLRQWHSTSVRKGRLASAGRTG